MTCPECSGTGLIWSMDQSVYGDEPCPRCDGHGEVFESEIGNERLTRKELNENQIENKMD